ncbi:MAG: hypothetical protein HYZ67_04375 [Chlamydiae bacterium]|nr:hypothetical protein [Chlamydiota bacterium]
MKINMDHIWDYDASALDPEREMTIIWYLSRVLRSGSMAEIRAIGLATLRKYFQKLTLPQPIYQFWEWYFSLPESEKKYGHLDQQSKTSASAPVKSAFFQA